MWEPPSNKSVLLAASESTPPENRPPFSLVGHFVLLSKCHDAVVHILGPALVVQMSLAQRSKSDCQFQPSSQHSNPCSDLKQKKATDASQRCWTPHFLSSGSAIIVQYFLQNIGNGKIQPQKSHLNTSRLVSCRKAATSVLLVAVTCWQLKCFLLFVTANLLVLSTNHKMFPVVRSHTCKTLQFHWLKPKSTCIYRSSIPEHYPEIS